jgi:hypothetical protein
LTISNFIRASDTIAGVFHLVVFSFVLGKHRAIPDQMPVAEMWTSPLSKSGDVGTNGILFKSNAIAINDLFIRLLSEKITRFSTM